MRYSVSTCSFYKFRIRRLLEMPREFGLEIFYEFGSQDQWESLLSILSARGLDSFSIHAPFAFVDISAPCDEGRLYDVLRRPFKLYHRYNGEFYVLHTYGEVERPETPEHLRDCRARAADRLARFQEICAKEGVRLAAENLCAGGTPMFSEEQFLELFRRIPDLSCVVDVGHALVSGMDVSRLQKALGRRIAGYHLHNNDGLRDTHARLREGIMDWAAFAENAARHTPDAIGVLEYMTEIDMEHYRQDAAYLDSLFPAEGSPAGEA